MKRMARVWAGGAAAWCMAVGFAAACGGPAAETKVGKNTEAAARAINNDPIQSENTGSAIIERIDINGDNKPDVFKHYALIDEVPADGKPVDPKAPKVQRKALVRKEIDVNFDQRFDIVEYYKGPPGKEVKEREEFDLDFDGRVDEVRKYEDGDLKEVQLDLGFDGKIDTWMFYQKTQNEEGKPVNRLVERRKDTNGDGAVDIWDYYVKGALQKTGVDTNGDGTPDQFTRVEEKR